MIKRIMITGAASIIFYCGFYAGGVKKEADFFNKDIRPIVNRIIQSEYDNYSGPVVGVDTTENLGY